VGITSIQPLSKLVELVAIYPVAVIELMTELVTRDSSLSGGRWRSSLLRV
jgi:hypothetical protein